MKKLNSTFSLVLIAAAFHTAASAADVGVSVSISQPGVFGRIDVGRVPAPAVIYPQPVIIEQRPVVVARQPIYLRVPPGHEKHWDKHCARYNACGQPVYFVQEKWYRDVYAPSYSGASEGRDGRHEGGDRRGEGGRHHKKDKREHGGD